MVGDTPSPEFIEYSTAKAGLINMAHSMAVASGPEVRYNEVRYNIVVIGSVDNGDATLEAGYDPAMLKKISDAIVMKRRGTPTDIAHAFVFLMSNAASWITGIYLMVDGGGMYESKMPS
ncbi:MAG: SDR family oxidoreductase [Muribaculaceae bacterium]|nr:SDR family oxidoreductase [Muribaculaceae bacterium]